MCLSWSVIGVLPEDHNLYLIKRCRIKRIEPLSATRIDDLLLSFLFMQKAPEILHIRCIKLILQSSQPAVLERDRHALVGFRSHMREQHHIPNRG